MAGTGPSLPPSFRQECLDHVDSTNAEVIRRAVKGEPGNLWIRARHQSAGRGRCGRQWASPAGNLYASLLLRLSCSLETALQLAFVAGIALFDAAARTGGISAGRLVLKWPNDLLLDTKKVGGILLESRNAGDRSALAVAIGTGLNLASHPDDTSIPATHLSADASKAPTGPDAAFFSLAQGTAHWLEAWGEGRGWSDIRQAWIERSLAPGTPISVKLGNGPAEGHYAGVDEAGALLLDANDGQVRVTAGDVFLLKP